MLVAEAGLSGFAEQKPDPVVEAFGAFGALAKSSWQLGSRALGRPCSR